MIVVLKEFFLEFDIGNSKYSNFESRKFQPKWKQCGDERFISLRTIMYCLRGYVHYYH